jgi:polygalacturonase
MVIDSIPEDRRVFGNGFLDLDGDGQDDGYGDGNKHWLRPSMIELFDCKNILISDLTIKNSPFLVVHPVFSKNITIKNLQIYSRHPVVDGIVLDSCEDVLIESCRIETGEDAIAVKAGWDPDAASNTSSSNIVIRKCRLNPGANSFCFGPEMSGGVENVFIENCDILYAKHLFNLTCDIDLGGQVQNIFIRNVRMDSLQKAMFNLQMEGHENSGNKPPAKFNDFYASNINCINIDSSAINIVGVETEPIKRIFLNNISIHKTGKENKIEFAVDILAKDVRINGKPWNP